MSESVGKVHLDLGIDYNKFNNELNGIKTKATNEVGGAFKKLGLIIASAFAVHEIIGFGKEAINLASDLSEVQNVVDVTFGSMSENVNQFAKDALNSFGMSELTAKKFTSTLGAMMKSSGLAGNSITAMSEELTGLAGDFASFYNLSQEVAFEKIRSGISGETEPLKQLGINLNVANLEAFSLTQGIKKQYSAMSQAEQVLLRYNYLLSVSKDAQGDFARTSDSWANQTRLLNEQWKIFQGTMGQGFINILRPVLKLINTLIARLQVAAQYFKAFTEVIFGASKASSSNAKASSSVSSGLGDVGKSAKSAGKAIKGSLSGFDELNVIGKSTSDSLGSAADGLLGLSGGMQLGEMPDLQPTVDTDKFVTKVKGMVEQVKSVFGTMFDGDYSSKLMSAFSGIGLAIKPLLDIKVPIQSALVSIGQSASSLLNGTLKPMASYLLTNYIPSIVGAFSTSFAPVFTDLLSFAVTEFATTFASVTAIVNDLSMNTWIPSIDIVKNAFVTSLPLIAQSIQSVLDNTIKPFLDFFINGFVLPISQSINEVFVPIFSVTAVFAITEFVKWFQWGATMVNQIYITLIKPTFDLIKMIVMDTLAIVQSLWTSHGTKLLSNLSQLMAGLRKMFNLLWTQVLKPIIIPFLDKLNWLWESHLKDLVFRVGEFVMKLVNAALEIVNKFIIPLVNTLIKVFGPAFSIAFSFISDVAGTFLGVMSDVLGGLIRALGGVIDFIMGIFTGDWKRAWQGVKDIFGGIFDGIVGILKGSINLIIDGINAMIRGLNRIHVSIPDWVPGLGGKSFGIHLSTIPKLAEGGLIQGPTLAMVGDNKNANVDPEVVSPLSKLSEMLNVSNQVVVEALMMILDAIERLDLNIDIDGETLTRMFKDRLRSEDARVGNSIVTIGGVPIR